MDVSGKDISNKHHPSAGGSFDHSNPLTSRGVRLPGGAELTVQVHECGSLVHKKNDWRFKQVSSPFWRVYQNDRAGCAVIFRDQRISLGPNRAVFIPEHVPFDCESRDGVAHLWIHFSLDHALCTTVAAPLVLELDQPMQVEFDKLRREVFSSDARTVLAHQSAGLLHLCLARLSDRLAPRPVSPRLRLLIGFIDHMLGSPLSNNTLAVRAGLSTGAFVRWFRRETGQTPAVYVVGRRVREACRRLAFTDASIEEIAEAVGFADRHHFSRVFKARMGCGPASFRKEPTRAKSGDVQSIAATIKNRRPARNK